MGEVNQSNVHLLLPWKVAALAALWAADLGVSRMEAQRRFYGTKFYRDLEDESTKLWTLSPEQLYLIFIRLHNAIFSESNLNETTIGKQGTRQDETQRHGAWC